MNARQAIKGFSIVLCAVVGLLAMVDSAWAYNITVFGPSVYDADTAVMDATLGVTGYSIEDFEHATLTLISGLSMTSTGSFFVILNSSVAAFPIHWDGSRALALGAEFGATVTFTITEGASSFGIGLSNNSDPLHTVQINGGNPIEYATLSGFVIGAPVVNGERVHRNGYLRIDAEAGDPPIASITFTVVPGARNDNFINFDHLAFQIAKEVEIDIRPGTAPNSINLKSNGKLSVAILTTDDFDATTVDPATVTLGNDDGNDTPVATKNNGRLFASEEDVDGDGRDDLLLHFEVPALIDNGDLNNTSTELVLNGETTDGCPIQGSDSVRIVGSSTKLVAPGQETASWGQVKKQQQE